MTDVADGIERVPTPDALRAAAETLVKKAEWARSRSGMQPAERDSWRELAEQLEAVSAWLAAFRTPAPAGDAVERVARAIDEDTAGVWLPYNVSRIGAARIMARAALAAMPAPQSGEAEVERAAVVKWLRKYADQHEPGMFGQLMGDLFADAIERGEHRAQEPAAGAPRACPLCKGKGTCLDVDAINPDGTVENPRPAVCMVCEGTGQEPTAGERGE